MKSHGNKHDFHDENEADLDDSDDPQWDDVAADGDDDADALPEMMCPSCRAAVTEDTQKCPKCGDWITPVEPKSSGMRRWLWTIFVIFLVFQMLMFFIT